MSTRTCFHCESVRVELDVDNRIWWCVDCGQATTPDQMFDWNGLFALVCEECGQDVYLEEGGTIKHDREDLVAPKCSRHKAELVAERRKQMRVVGGRT